MTTTVDELITYSVTDAALQEMKRDFMSLTVKDLTDLNGYKDCDAARKLVKEKRLDVEKRRKELKADALEYGRKVDGEAKRITAQLEEIESYLEGQQAIVDNEKKRLKQEAEAAAKRQLDSRIAQLQQYRGQITIDHLMIVDEPTFQTMLAAAKQKFDAEESAKAEREAELERLRQSQREQDEKNRQLQAQIDEQNRKEAERQRQEKEKADRERWEREQKERLEREAKERQEAAERKAKEDQAAELKRQEDEAAAKIADEQMFQQIKTDFNTLPLAWQEIARLNKLNRKNER